MDVTFSAYSTELKNAGLDREKRPDGSYDFVDKNGHVRASWIPKSGKEPAHWSKFEPGGADQKAYLDNAGRPVSGEDPSHRMPSK